MAKLLTLKLACLIIILLMFVPNLTGCQAGGPVSTPLLPQGLVDTPVPDVNLDGYIYLNQGSTIIISPDFSPVNIPQISIESLQLWLGPDVSSIGGAVNFESQADADSVSTLIKSFNLPVWSLTNGKVIYAVNNNSGQWTSSMENALTRQQMVSPATKYPEVQGDFAYFPANPPLKPVAAGFIDLNGSLVDSIGTTFSLSLTNYMSTLKFAKISRISFQAYSAQPLVVSSRTITEEYINSLQLGILALGRSSYPGIFLSLFFDKAMSSAGFTKYSMNNVDLYEYPLGSAKLLVARNGNVIYAATSQTKELTEKLLLSCF